MIRRAYGASGLEVSVLGLGAGALGDARLDEQGAERLIDVAIDLGVTLFDTARSYGLSEERLGRYLGSRRQRVVISTKGGYGVDGAMDWTGAAVRRGIDDALVRMQTAWIDVFHLHSCPLETLRNDEILRALDDARDAGKIRIAAYSGENDALLCAAESGKFGGLQCSVNPFDQRSLDVVGGASSRGLGVIAKRALGNCPWRFAERPRGDYAETYWERMRAMNFDPAPQSWVSVAMRFGAFARGVSSVLIGTSSPEHLASNATILEHGPLDAATHAAIRDAFRRRDDGWIGQI